MSLRQRLGLGGLRQRTMVRLTTGIGGFLAAGVALVMTIASYGKDEALPSFRAGAPIEAGQWRVVPLSARIDGATPDGRPVRGGGKAVVVEVELTNRTAESSNSFYRLLTLDPPIGEDRPDVFLLRDRDRAAELHPDLTERLAMVWILPREAAVPAVLKLAVHGSTYKRRDNLRGQSGWYNPQVIGTVDLPVQGADPA
ncbi:hypothetical protein [Inquilinus limosus]|uniref:hypothetical protein n=1 Tax=Inquilinus limosus TaxID=171674 RepID=UPI0012DC0B0F|nr:hypothetical protein [Inquilinus limosus]